MKGAIKMLTENEKNEIINEYESEINEVKKRIKVKDVIIIVEIIVIVVLVLSGVAVFIWM